MRTKINYQFSTLNFQPRGGTEDFADGLLQQIMEWVPKDANCQVKGKRVNDGFYFSVVLSYRKKMFSSDIYLRASETSQMGRDWMRPVVDHLTADVLSQVDDHRRSGWNFAKENPGLTLK